MNKGVFLFCEVECPINIKSAMLTGNVVHIFFLTDFLSIFIISKSLLLWIFFFSFQFYQMLVFCFVYFEA